MSRERISFMIGAISHKINEQLSYCEKRSRYFRGFFSAFFRILTISNLLFIVRKPFYRVLVINYAE